MNHHQAPQAQDAPGAPTGHPGPSQGVGGASGTQGRPPEARCQSCGQATEECRAHLTAEETMRDSYLRGVFSAGVCRMPRYHDHGIHEGRSRMPSYKA